MSYTKTNLLEVDDAAQRFGDDAGMEARFATGVINSETSGLAFHRIAPGRRQPFGHRHNKAEEICVVTAGSGRAKIDDEIVELATHDILTLPPELKRSFEAGDDGMDLLVFGPHHEKDGELDPDFWKD